VLALLIAHTACGKSPLDLTIDLKPSLAGVVTNRVTKLAIAGVVVRCQNQTVLTETNGLYIFPGEMKTGTFSVTTTHPDYVDGERNILIDHFNTEGNFQLEPKF
jgi:hypothetical protein